MAWRLALRVARREALRNKGRSLLVAAMIALPVAGASAADTLWRSSQLTAAESATRTMGHYDAVIQGPSEDKLVQLPDGSDQYPVLDAKHTPVTVSGAAAPSTPNALGNSLSPPSAKSPSDLLSLLPAGSRVIPNTGSASAQGYVLKGHSRVWTDLQERDLADLLQDGITVHRSGTAPTKDDEVAVTTSMLDDLKMRIGDTIDVQIQQFGSDSPPAASKHLRITGVYDLPSNLGLEAVMARPGVFTGSTEAAGGAGSSALALVPGGVAWNLVKQLNDHGYTATSRNVLENPPPASDVPAYVQYAKYHAGGAQENAATYAVAGIAVSMVLLEIVLLAGPAFAVSVRRRRRDFGLLGAAGADGRRLRHIVLADGIVLGLAGGVLGVLVGVAASAACLPWLDDFSNSMPGGFRVMPVELLAAATVGVVTGVIAALAPAVATSRQDVLVSLTGRRGQVRTPWRLPVIGVAAIVAGSAMIAFGAFSAGLNTLPIVAGIAVAELGVVACTPILVSWSGKLARFLPLAGRLALRDGARNRGRTAPAVAAIMAAVAGATAVAMYLSTQDAKARAEYSSSLRDGQVSVSLRGVTGLDGKQVLSRIGAGLPAATGAIVSTVDDTSDKAMIPALVRVPANMCPPPPQGAQSEAVLQQFWATEGADPRCHSGMTVMDDHFPANGIAIAGPELLKVMTGVDNAAAEAVLRSGGAVVFDPLDLATSGPNPTVTISAIAGHCMSPDPAVATEPECAKPAHTISVPAIVVDDPKRTVTVVVAPGTLDKLGVAAVSAGVVFNTTRMPSGAEQQKADDAAAALGITNQVYVERGYSDDIFVGLLALAAVAAVITLGAAAVATGLAITDAQSDLETLAAVGARPRVRRILAGSQAAVTAGLGAVLGAAFGLIPAAGLIEAQANGFEHSVATAMGDTFKAEPTYLTVPWLFLGLTIVVLPVLAALGASLFTRSRIDLRRRRA